MQKANCVTPIVLKNQQGKDICGTVKSIDQHKRPYMNSPFSLELSLKGKAHFRPVSQEAEALLHVIVPWPVKQVQFFKVFAD